MRCDNKDGNGLFSKIKSEQLKDYLKLLLLPGARRGVQTLISIPTAPLSDSGRKNPYHVCRSTVNLQNVPVNHREGPTTKLRKPGSNF